MPVRVPYWKQAAFAAMLVATLAAAVEGGAHAWHYLSTTGCFSNEGEAAARTMDMQTRRQACSDYASMQYLPYSYPDKPRLLVPGYHTDTVNVDSLGFRGSGFEVPKPEGTYRIVVLGGSAAFGAGVPDGMTIPAYLEASLDADFPYRVEVINAGVPGGTSFGERWRALNQLPEVGPDLVVVYSGYNDSLARHDNPGIAHFAHVRELDGAQGTDPDPLREAWRATKTRALLERAQFEIDARTGSYAKLSFDRTPIPEKAEAWRERMESVCKTHEAAVFLQPLAEESNTTDLRARTLADKWNNGRAAEVMDAYAAQLDELDGACAVTGDLRRSLDDAPVPVMADFVHLTAPGNEIMAHQIKEKIRHLLPERLD